MIAIFEGLTTTQILDETMPIGFCLMFLFGLGLFLFWHWAIAEGYREAAKTMRKEELIRNRKQEAVMDEISRHWRN